MEYQASDVGESTWRCDAAFLEVSQWTKEEWVSVSSCSDCVRKGVRPCKQFAPVPARNRQQLANWGSLGEWSLSQCVGHGSFFMCMCIIDQLLMTVWYVRGPAGVRVDLLSAFKWWAYWQAWQVSSICVLYLIIGHLHCNDTNVVGVQYGCC